MRKFILLLRIFVASEFKRWEVRIINLHVRINKLVKILALVRLQNHWKVVAVPFSIMSSLCNAVFNPEKSTNNLH